MIREKGLWFLQELGLGFGVLAFLCLISNANAENSDGKVGTKAPPIMLKDAHGKIRKLADLQGKKSLIITFFPKCFTFNCTNQLSSLSEHYKELQESNIDVWGVSTDSAEGPRGQKAFSESLHLPFPLLPDVDRDISLKFGAVQSQEQMAARMTVFVDKQGIIRWVDKQINPQTHGSDVVERLKKEGYISMAER